MPSAARKTAPAKRAPQQRRALERIEGILTATETVLAEDGYEGLAMVKIAAQAGITHTSIYHYFRSVEDILSTLLERLMGDYDRRVGERLARAETPSQLVEAVLESIALGFSIYRTSPVARGLWAATRYLPALRKIDEDDTLRNATLFSERFMALAPDADRDAVGAITLLAASLAVPAYATALLLDGAQQDLAMENFLAMIRAHYCTQLHLESPT